MNYAVVFSYSFDYDVAVYLFKTFEEARSWLSKSLMAEYRIQTDENGWDAYYEVNGDGTYAKLVTQFFDHDDVMEIRLGCVYSAHG